MSPFYWAAAVGCHIPVVGFPRHQRLDNHVWAVGEFLNGQTYRAKLTNDDQGTSSRETIWDPF
jgi:hypothetical protein